MREKSLVESIIDLASGPISDRESSYKDAKGLDVERKQERRHREAANETANDNQKRSARAGPR